MNMSTLTTCKKNVSIFLTNIDTLIEGNLTMKGKS
jgi:hypothetical protein